MSTLQITKFENKVVRGGKLVTDTAFVVVDADGGLIGRKQHASEADAKAELGELKHYATGLGFIKATNPDLADKAQVGKGKNIAAYLQWLDDGKPVKEAPLPEKETAGEETTTTETTGNEVAGDTAEVEDDESF